VERFENAGAELCWFVGARVSVTVDERAQNLRLRVSGFAERFERIAQKSIEVATATVGAMNAESFCGEERFKMRGNLPVRTATVRAKIAQANTAEFARERARARAEIGGFMAASEAPRAGRSRAACGVHLIVNRGFN